MSSIYSISNWQSSTFYKKNTIVKNNGYYRYALVEHTSALSFDESKWGGITTYGNGQIKYDLFWPITYGASATHEPKIKEIVFGNGYVQRASDGINSDLVKFDISFDNRDQDEITAITHFFYNLNGRISFVWIAPPPYASQKLYICKTWTPSMNFKNNYSLKATLEQSAV